MSKRFAIVIYDAVSTLLVAFMLSFAFTSPAFAYIDPSVMTYTIQAVAGVAVALSAVAGVALRRGRKHLNRILDIDEPKEQLAVRMDEYLVFKRTAWVLHRTRFLYDLVFTVRDGGYSVVMQRIRYLYLEQEYEGAEPERRTAEDWITDVEALSPKGKLLKKTRKFRVFTIDRKDAVFAEAYAAAQK